MAGRISTARRARCLTISLENIAKRNSLDLPMLEELAHVAREAAADGELAVVVLRGAGREAFCAGADFDAMTAPPLVDSVMRMDAALEAAIAALDAIEVPLVAAIEGACFGGGLQIALAADVRIASAGARFGVPAAQMGIAYPFQAISQMTALCGSGAASFMFLSGEAFDAPLALHRRLVEEVVAADGFETRLGEIVDKLAASPRLSAVSYKKMIRLLAREDREPARRIHGQLMDARLFLPKLEAVLAKRRARDLASRDGAAPSLSGASVQSTDAKPAPGTQGSGGSQD